MREWIGEQKKQLAVSELMCGPVLVLHFDGSAAVVPGAMGRSDTRQNHVTSLSTFRTKSLLNFSYASKILLMFFRSLLVTS